jgi:universal stress protein E
MLKLRRLLVPINDLRARPHAAARKAAQIAVQSGATIELFHAYDDLVDVYALPDALEPRSFEVVEHEKVRRRLEAIADRLRATGAQVTTAVETDHPAHEAVIRRAARIGADLIVVDTHSKHRTPSVLRVTDWELLRHSPVPVLLVKNGRSYHNPVILAAVDPRHSFSKPTGLDAAILEASAVIGEALEGPVHALHSYVPIPATVVSSEMVTPDLAQRLQRIAKRDAKAGLTHLLRDSGIPPRRRHLVPMHPLDAIPRTVRRVHAGILVMGAVSRGGLKRIFIGNTAERVLDDLKCDVLIVKPKSFDARVPKQTRGIHWRLLTAMPPL